MHYPRIQGLGGAEAMIKEEAEMLLVPVGKLTAKLEEAAKEDGQMVRDTEWLEQLWRDQHGDDEIEVYPLTSKKRKAAQKDRLVRNDHRTYLCCTANSLNDFVLLSQPLYKGLG